MEGRTILEYSGYSFNNTCLGETLLSLYKLLVVMYHKNDFAWFQVMLLFLSQKVEVRTHRYHLP